jgi:hypothetical protein
MLLCCAALLAVGCAHSGSRQSALHPAGPQSTALGTGITSLILFVPKEFPRRHWRDMIILVGSSMFLM